MTSRTFDVALSLRQHGASLRQLAAELLRDPDAADDAVQEVWASALQRPPRHVGSPGGWLATALRTRIDTSPLTPTNEPMRWIRRLPPGTFELRLRDHLGRTAVLTFAVAAGSPQRWSATMR